MWSEFADLLGQLIEIERGRIVFHFDRRTLANVAAQLRAYFV